MGSGCSSPLRRFGGGKKCKHQTRNSEAELQLERDRDNNNNDNENENNVSTAHQCQPHRTQQILEQEITIQSEYNDDHPSSASCNTDAARNNHNEELRLSDNSTNQNAQQSLSGAQVSLGAQDNSANSNSLNNASASSRSSLLARIKGLNGSYVPHDRHLLVSPALSPAPSTCYSPSPASSNQYDLADLQEAFGIITFGLSKNENDQKRIKFAQSKQSQQLSSNLGDVHHNFTQLLDQCRDDLINYITVIFITTDHFQFGKQEDKKANNQSTTNRMIDYLANQLENNLRIICDEHLFKLKFLNFSQEHLIEHFHINNLVDATMLILEQERQYNSQRIMIIVLSGNSSTLTGTTGIDQMSIDKKQLPSKIDTQSMIELRKAIAAISSGPNSSTIDRQCQEKLEQWYNLAGGYFHLKPIYSIYPQISSDIKDERDQAWYQWLKDSGDIVKAIEMSQTEVGKLDRGSPVLNLMSLSDSYIEFILKEPALQKRTLLVKNLSLSTQQSQLITSSSNSLNDLTKLLSDTNKLTFKRSHSQEEFLRTVGDWINESFDKLVNSILENDILNGKHIPPFIDENLFVELTAQKNHLHEYLDTITDSFATKSQTFYSNQLYPILNDVFTDTNSNSNQIISGSQTQPRSANHLVFISGPRSCGKSSLFSQLVKLTAQDFFEKTQIIYRFLGVGLESLTPNRLFRSICEQFCQTQGENIAAASYIYSARKEIINALNKIIKTQYTFIFLDGIDSYEYFDISDLDWLCELEGSSQVKIIIMLNYNSELYKKSLEAYSDATHITLDNPSVCEWVQMLNSNARARRYTSTGNIYDGIKNIESNDDINLSYDVLNAIMNACRLRRLNNETTYPELSFKEGKLVQNMNQLLQTTLTNLHYIIPANQLCSLIVVLQSSRNGLYEVDIIKIMSSISQSSSSSKSSSIPADLHFSTTQFNYLKHQLKPWLKFIICDRALKITIDEQFSSRALQHYVSGRYPNIIAETREHLIDYFSRQTRAKKSISSFKGTESCHTIPGDSSELLKPAEGTNLASQTSELSHLLVLTNKSKAIENFVSKNQFYLQFLYGSRPEEFIEDCERLTDESGRKSSNSNDLQTLLSYIKQSIYPLRYDGSQIYSQIYCRAYDSIKSGKAQRSKKLSDILNTASIPPVRSLLPVSKTSIDSFTITRIGSTASQGNKPGGPAAQGTTQLSANGPNTGPQRYQQSRQKIFTIRDNHRHVVVVHPDKGSLSVWDIYEEKAVRTIQNLDHPKDLRMIDQKRAVILCNRELRVYDLDSGNLITKLKGVMNQKMPYFEVYGDDYVVALARNRMYVNMLNLSTGEMETTFKVGEDRFLNSLLVSANGGICVCGDETQKPFPLLVWNLNERRLMYDLRMDRHEFVTRMSAISDDGHFVVSVCKQIGDADSSYNGSNGSDHSQPKHATNFIVIYDLSSGTMFKKWKPGLDTWGVAISYSANRSGKVISSMVDCSIIVWDLVTGSKRHRLTGHSAPADTVRVQGSRLFSMDSYCCDQSLRIWDIEDGCCLAVFSPDAPVSCCQLSIRGDAIVCGFASENRLSTLVVCKNETVNDVVKRNKRRKSSKSLYIFDEPPSRKPSS